MAVTVAHTTQSATPDSGDGKISSNAWNEDHAIVGLGTAAESDTTDFAAAAHAHVIADVTGLQAALDGKQASGSYLTSITGSDVTTALGYTPTSVTGLTGTQSVAAFKTGLTLVKGDVGLGSVDNTTDLGKPISTATQTALDGKLTVTAGSGGFTGYTEFATDTGLYLQSSGGSKIAIDVAGGCGLLYAENNTASEYFSIGGDLNANSHIAFDSTHGIEFTLVPYVGTNVMYHAGTAAGSFPTLNQNTTGSAATLTTGRTIAMTGDVAWTSASFNGSGNVTGTSTIGAGKVTRAMMANTAAATVLGSTAAGAVAELTAAQAKTFLSIAESDVTNLTTDLAAKASLASPQFTGVAYYQQSAPTARNSTTTLTIADLLTLIITSTSASAVSLTLPTGTLTDAGILSGALGTNEAFEWYVINLGSSSGAVTILAGTAHTIVGNAVVAISTSARFLTRKTATNTFVTYRIA